MIVGVAGVGLLGGSIGYILRKKRWADKVIGIGRNEERLKKAVEMKAVDEYICDFDSRLSEIDMLILAVPVVNIVEYIKKAAPFLKKGAIVTDVGSTKGYITAEVEKLLPEGVYFVGGHPMAGSEKTGVEALDPYIFENAVYIITASKKSNEQAIAKVKEMVKVLDANAVEIDAVIHDEAVASISHLPHIVAAALLNNAAQIEEHNKYVFPFAAGGFRDTTRIASGSPDMWRDICLTNKDKILETIDTFDENIKKFRDAVEAGSGKDIYNLFETARLLREKLPKKKKGIISPMLEIVVFIHDRPGEIGRISNLLGENGINIKDIEVLNVRENEGGSIRIGIELNGKESETLRILRANGYEVKIIE